jgi:CBS domain-containing protein
MSTPVRSIDESELMETAVRTFILSDIHRLFVHRGEPGTIVGVLTLTDAARLRSGSCRACIAGRIRVEQES